MKAVLSTHCALRHLNLARARSRQPRSLSSRLVLAHSNNGLRKFTTSKRCHADETEAPRDRSRNDLATLAARNYRQEHGEEIQPRALDAIRHYDFLIRHLERKEHRILHRMVHNPDDKQLSFEWNAVDLDLTRHRAHQAAYAVQLPPVSLSKDKARFYKFAKSRIKVDRESAWADWEYASFILFAPATRVRAGRRVEVVMELCWMYTTRFLPRMAMCYLQLFMNRHGAPK